MLHLALIVGREIAGGIDAVSGGCQIEIGLIGLEHGVCLVERHRVADVRSLPGIAGDIPAAPTRLYGSPVIDRKRRERDAFHIDDGAADRQSRHAECRGRDVTFDTRPRPLEGRRRDDLLA